MNESEKSQLELISQNSDGISGGEAKSVLLFYFDTTEILPPQPILKGEDLTSNKVFKKQNKEAFLKVYPNPAHHHMVIEVGNSKDVIYPIEIDLLDVSGKRMNTFVINTDREFLNLSTIDQGLYFLSCRNKQYLPSIIKLIITK